MQAEEALEQSGGKTVYARFHGDLLTLTRREDDGTYILEFSDVHDTRRRGLYINDRVSRILERDKRYLAEWYLTEEEARAGKQPEEFYIYTMAIYQHTTTKALLYVKFCNGEIERIAQSMRGLGNSSEETQRQRRRNFLLHTDEYQHVTSWWEHTLLQSTRDRVRIKATASREMKYHYVFFSLRDNRAHDEYHENLEHILHLAKSHFGGNKKRPLYVEGLDMERTELHMVRVPGRGIIIPELEKE